MNCQGILRSRTVLLICRLTASVFGRCYAILRDSNCAHLLNVVRSTGTYGTVFKAKNRETHEIVALKRVRLDDDDEVVNIYINTAFIGCWQASSGLVQSKAS